MNRWSPSPNFLTYAVIGITFVAAFMAGRLVQILHVGPREIAIFMVVVMLMILVLVPSERVLRAGFILWIITFGFGWRTLYLTPSLTIHPAEVIVVLMFFLIITRSIMTHNRLDFSLPFPIPLFTLLVLMAIPTGVVFGIPVDAVIQEAKSLLEIVFCYYVVKWMVQTQQDWERAVNWCIAVGTYIGILGLMDVFFPELSRVLAANESAQTLYIYANLQGEVFARSNFLFFGSGVAGFVIFTFLGFSLYAVLEHWSARTEKYKTMIIALALIVQVVGIYLSGLRGVWYASIGLLAVYALFQRRAWGFIAAGALALPLLPIEFFNRFQSVFNSQFADSSQFERFARARYAFDLFLQSPLMGVGWGGSGYVHSDLLQIAADAGIFGILAFLIWIALIFYQLFRTARTSGWARNHAAALIAMMAGLVVLLAGEGSILYVQLVMPIWFVFIMAHRLFELVHPHPPGSVMMRIADSP